MTVLADASPPIEILTMNVLSSRSEIIAIKWRNTPPISFGWALKVYLNWILAKPNVTTNCSSLVAKNEGDKITCLCKSEGGNPSATLLWKKDNVPISYVRYKESTLTLTNITKSVRGTYKCVAQCHHENEEISNKVIVFDKNAILPSYP